MYTECNESPQDINIKAPDDDLMILDSNLLAQKQQCEVVCKKSNNDDKNSLSTISKNNHTSFSQSLISKINPKSRETNSKNKKKITIIETKFDQTTRQSCCSACLIV